MSSFKKYQKYRGSNPFTSASWPPPKLGKVTQTFSSGTSSHVYAYEMWAAVVMLFDL
uniref:Uncharacterized protein n=1 Tax=Anguilla anguilla TaxID=7936 RepID=A0A0E9VU78_ANGAN